MDWYLIGRILGVVFWPSLVAVLVYGIGLAIATTRPPQLADNIRRWARVAAFAGFLVMLIIAGRDFLRYASGAS